MLRTLLLVLPFTLVAALLGLVVMIPVTWVVRDIGPIYAVARAVLRMAFRLAGVRIETHGADPWSTPQPCVFVANHASNLDPPLVFVCLPRVAIMGKAIVFRWPLFGYALKMAEFIPVDRGRAESRRRALEAGADRLKRGISLALFPEGTRSPDGNLLPFRPGAFSMAIEAQAPVVPITIVGGREVMAKGHPWIRPGLLKLLFHPPVPTRGLGPADRAELVGRVREAIASALPLSPTARSS